MSNNELALHRRGFMFVLSSPSGAGKTTLSRMILEKDKNLEMSISVTTRKMRPGERDGIDYFFIDRENFGKKVAKGELLECAEIYGNMYGTPADVVEKSLESGKDVLFDIDWQGTAQLQKSRRDDVVSVFILPPSIEELDRRLHKRAQDDEQSIALRMAKAGNEIIHWTSYDYVVVNHDVEKSLQHIFHILNAERVKRNRQQGLSDFVTKLIQQTGKYDPEQK